MLLAGFLAAAAASALSGREQRDDYERLQEWRYSASAIPLPAGGLTIVREVAEWRLESGRFWLQEPTAEGTITGLVFEGEGRFRMSVPNPFELDQLRRFTLEPELEALDEEFSRLVLRTSDRQLLRDLAAPQGGAYKPHKLARERHEHWLKLRRHDADARVVAALANGGDPYLRVGIKSRARGWLTFDYDPQRMEEIRLEVFRAENSFVEIWLGLEREAERGPVGRGTGAWIPPLDVERATIEARLLELGKDASTQRDTIDGEFRAALDYRCRQPGHRAFSLNLHPLAEVLEVTDGGGRPLAFLRDHVGARSSAIDNRIHDLDLVVLLEEPAACEGLETLRFHYRMEIGNYAPGRYWYPAVETPEVGLRDLHTAELTVITRDAYKVWAMGEPLDASGDGRLITRSWRIDEPVKMLTFAFARRAGEERMGGDGSPAVVVFGPPVAHDNRNRLREAARDVLRSTAFYQQLFDTELPGQVIQAAIIQASHGQAFDGFLHLSEAAAYRDRTGPSEKFLAHEVAHQWWGHRVGWRSYRDQWLSEGLAEYSAMMYLQARLEKGEKLFRDILRAYSDELTGSVQSALSPFTRAGLVEDNRAASRRIGPIAHGFRAAVSSAPSGYFSQAYHKGALVLHMLRVLSRFLPDGEEHFYAVLREVAREFEGERLSTSEFEEVVERHYPGDWAWFFDQWVRRAGIPSYKWSHKVDERADPDGLYTIRLRVRQSGVPEDFRMPVPVRVEYPGGETEELLAVVDAPELEIELKVPKRPKKVIFNPDNAVLARGGR